MLKKENLISIFVIFSYITLIIGFIVSEDLNGGAFGDWGPYTKIIDSFSINFLETFLNYHTLGDRHSPITHIFLSFFVKIGFSYDVIRMINLHLMLLIPFFIYKCLSIKFDKVDKKYLVLIAASVFFSTTYRSLSIWPDARIYGLLFFIISLKFFLQFSKFKKINFAYLNIFFLSISSYFSPNFSLFSIYFFWYYFLEYKYSLNTLKFILLNTLLSLPAFYYLFILEVNFILQETTPGSSGTLNLNSSELNYYNKILIITSIMFFYLIPFISLKKFADNFSKKYKILFIIIPLFILSVYNFDYKLMYTGGGIFFLASNYLLNSNYFFYIICAIAFYYVFYKYFNYNNLFIILILILSNIQLTIYHKYYDPLLLLLFLTLFRLDIDKIFFNYRNIIKIYSINIIFILSKIVKLII
tara:strand:+ start:237 stop:1478 length:1242 start_codon:yes stop_codon:yes gene_type:complete